MWLASSWNGILTLLVASTAIAIPVNERTKSTNHTRQLTLFGERPAFSPDGKKIAFMDKSYGDAFEIDLETKNITIATHYPNAGYLRVQYLPNGDLFLIGSRTYVDFQTTRDTTQEMWVLKPGETEPVALDHRIYEGVAISRDRNRIAWANTDANLDGLKHGESVAFVADIVYNNGTPALANQHEVLRAMAPECILEPQDFFDNDRWLTYTCYTETQQTTLGKLYGINLETKETVLYRSVPGEYNEIEGIYPNGRYSLVESAKDQANPNTTFGIDIWRMRLEPNTTDFVRLTHFTDNPPNKTGNPVVSPDGCTGAVALGRGGDPAVGAGYGIFLFDLE